MPRAVIEWARQSSTGRQEVADGSRLVNFYAVRAATQQAAQEAKYPVILYGAPGIENWFQALVNLYRIEFFRETGSGGEQILLTGIYRNKNAIWGLKAIESSVYGTRLIMVGCQNLVMQMRFDGQNQGNITGGAGAPDPASGANDDIHVQTGSAVNAGRWWVYIDGEWVYQGNITANDILDEAIQNTGYSAFVGEVAAGNRPSSQVGTANDVFVATDGRWWLWTNTWVNVDSTIRGSSILQRTRPQANQRYDPDGLTEVRMGSQDVFRFTEEEELYIDSPITLAFDGRRVLWASQHTVHMLDLETNTVVRIDGPDLAIDNIAVETDQWVDAAWVDGYFFMLTAHGKLVHSLLNSHEFDQLDFEFASTNPDKGVGLAVFERKLYVLGQHSVEVWFNTGGSDFAFSRDNSYAIHVGCANKDTIQVFDSGIYFVGSDSRVYGISQSQRLAVSNENVTAAIELSDMSKVRAFSYIEEGHNFYCLILTGQEGFESMWVFDLQTLLWHERTDTDITVCERFRDTENIVAQRTPAGTDDPGQGSGVQLYKLTLGKGSDSTLTATSPVLASDQRRVRMYSIEIDIPISADAELGDSDTAMLELSDDGGRTWMNVGTKKLSSERLKWNRLGAFRHGRQVRLTVSSNQRITVLGAYAEVDVTRQEI